MTAEMAVARVNVVLIKKTVCKNVRVNEEPVVRLTTHTKPAVGSVSLTYCNAKES